MPVLVNVVMAIAAKVIVNIRQSCTCQSRDHKALDINTEGSGTVHPITTNWSLSSFDKVHLNTLDLSITQ